MPFRFGMRKAKRYDVSSKNSYIVCVHLLDSVLIECTLNAESTGQECLENISTRIGLNEIQYFGLRYLNKKTFTFRWVNLDKPLKKQLEKHAQSSLLYFGVMFCIGDVLQIQDEMSRYQYYLHLKTEIIDGRLQCTPEQAIVLAAYSVQAELGNYKPETHGNDYLNNLVLLPQNMSTEDHIVKQLTHEIASMHQQLIGFPPSSAKLQYIIEAQELEGYGLEYYPVKDTAGKELLLGTSFVGIFVKPLSGNQPTVYFKWSDIVNFTRGKRQLGIDTKLSDKPFFFLLDSAEYAKYVYQMCCRQQKFYKSNSNLQTVPSENRENEDYNAQQFEDSNTRAIPDLQQDVMSSSANDINPPTSVLEEYLQSVNESSHTVIINESSSLNEEPLHTSLHQLHFVGPEMPPRTSVPGPEIHGTSVQRLAVPDNNFHSNGMPVNEIYQHDVPVGISSMYSIPGARTDQGIVQPIDFARLPSYRPPPDYKTIMCQKMDRIAQQVQQLNSTSGTAMHFPQEVLAYSQPDIHQMPLQYVTYYNNGHTFVERPFYGTVEEIAGYLPPRPVDRTSSLIVYPSDLHHDILPPYQQVGRVNAVQRPMLVEVRGDVVNFQPSRPVDRANSCVAYSTVTHRDGAAVSHMENVPDVAALFQYRLPPPYPRQSTSTPDLALQMANVLSHSTPDLATCHGRPHLLMQSRFDQSVENLALDNPQVQFLQFHPPQSKKHFDLPSSSQAVLSQYTDLGESSRSNGRIEFSRPSGQNQISQSTDQFEVDHSIQPPHSDVARNVASRSNNTVTPNVFSQIDLSRMVMLQHLEKQNQEYLQSVGANHTAASNEYIEQLRLQEIFRSIRLNAETGQVPKPKDELQPARVASGRQEILVEASHIKSNGYDSPGSGHINNLPNRSGSNSKASQVLKESKENEVNKSIFAPMTSASLVPASPTVSSSSANSHVQLLVENSAVRGDAGFAEAETGPSKSRADSQTPETKLEDSQVFAEFEQVPKKRLKFDCSTAFLDVNRDRNRFRDVVPYEDNRVQLQLTRENPSGYINASHIRVGVGKEEFWYIATQGPLEKTVGDFWQMVWENDVRVISMLTGFNDPEQRKCAGYWPSQSGSEYAIKCLDFSITLRYVTECLSYVTRGLIVRNDSTCKERLVWHLQYIDWPDRGCPTNHSGFLEYLDELSAIRRQVLTEQNSRKPICVVVHCSAGVGRTGVLILTEMMRTTVEHNGKIDVPSALKTLRDQRMHMVQTVSQYSFVYQIIGLYLQSSRLI